MELPPPETGDAFRMLVDGGEVVIEFGRIDRTAPNAAETAVMVTDRMKLPLETSLRLLHNLASVLRPYESQLRAAQAKTLPPGEAGLAARPGLAPAPPPTDQSGEQAAKLLQLVGAWGVPRQFERSFRIAPGTLQSNRFLLTVNPADIPGNARDAALAVCSEMGMPPSQRAAAASQFTAASTVHFGFEGDAGSIITKLYLEHAVSPEAARLAHAKDEPVLLHLAFKWPVLGGEAVTTRYLWHPLLTADEIALRLGTLYGGKPSEPRDIALGFLQQGAEKTAAERLQYLEVEELENGRRSFDLNLYNAGLAMKDAQPLLQRMRSHFGLRPGQFQALYDQVKAMSLGHVAGGVHRDGREFFNIYYGMANLPTFNRKL